MKIIKEGSERKKFKPFKILVETEAEAKVLWHRLLIERCDFKNYTGEFFNDFCKLENKVDGDGMWEDVMWNKLNNELRNQGYNLFRLDKKSYEVEDGN